jgi:murein endopeptidase
MASLMRALVGLVVASGLLAGVSSAAEARTKSSGAASDRRAGTSRGKAAADKHGRSAKLDKPKPPQRKTRAARIATMRGHERIEIRELARGQSVGAPWAGHLQHPTLLPPGEGYFLRHPARAFGTETTVALIERAINETLEQFPVEHVLAIGDISAESGGPITQHRSHQAGRDVDIGLFYNEQPAGYPESFIHADETNLDCAATFKLLERFLATTGDDGGVQMIFLDFDVQGLLYNWAVDQGMDEARLDRIFQYPHGRGSSEGIVRHVANHDNHMHVRFQCQRGDTACQ